MPSLNKLVLDLDTSRLQQKLRAMSKHFGALADELADIEARKCSECGGSNLEVEELVTDNMLLSRSIRCRSCGHEESESFG
ncbi:hypothetical protein NCCP2716_23410 [Sporosarcina sp. NCCP-2716]|nr:hypothetical protein NCCP2716_23410 [Sporosarcina sp. NCCP-2716]